ncbi:uncharacterized protein TNCV_2147641 [Trichonephila clavipes]|uniref:Uncharacterized protein n=1 Tax=Trichonephila clavipes TaxID=2585209 RepID=A0A8X6SXP5_TRICX|nr:uncharacterized protein TNCV_2147641 [Trichonephila clavipes]
MFKEVIHYRERNTLQRHRCFRKGRQRVKSMDALDVHRLPKSLKTKSFLQWYASSSSISPLGLCCEEVLLTSESERCHLHEDQTQDALDRPVVKKTATSGPYVFLNLTKDRRSVWSGAMHKETGLQRNGSRSSLATNPDSISAIAFVCGDPVVSSSIMPLLYSDTLLPQLVKMVWSHLSTRQCSASHGKGIIRLSAHCYYISLTFMIPDLSPIEHIWDLLGRRVELSTSLNELDARLQQMWNEISEYIVQNMYASMPDPITSCIRA